MSRTTEDLVLYGIVAAIFVGMGAGAIVLGAGIEFLNILCENLGGMDVWWFC